MGESQQTMYKFLVSTAATAAVLLCASVANAEILNMNATDATVGLPNPFVHLHFDEGWTKFKFGAANSTVWSKFIIKNDRAAILKVTDYYCSGDSFEVFDNGVSVGRTSQTVFDNCTSTTCDPDYAYGHKPWSSFSMSLAPGAHNITLKVLTSPYNEGFAAIRIDPLLLKCCLSMSGLTLIDTHVSYSSAEHACSAFGMKLADIDVANFNDATKVVFGCGGAYGSAYIKSYWGTSNKSGCLALYTGSSVPGGAISTPVDCTKKMPVLCQGETTSCHRHFLRA